MQVSRLRTAVLQQEEGVGDLGHQRPAAQQVAERRPRRPVLVGQQPGDSAPLLSAGDQSDGAVPAGDHVESKPSNVVIGRLSNPPAKPGSTASRNRRAAPRLRHSTTTDERPVLPDQPARYRAVSAVVYLAAATTCKTPSPWSTTRRCPSVSSIQGEGTERVPNGPNRR